MAFRRIVGFAPDEDPTTDGILKSGSKGLVATTKGMQAAAGPTGENADTLTATAVGATTQILLDGSVRSFAGTVDSIFELDAPTWTDVSGDTYNASKWRFTQLGDTTVAAAGKNTAIQRSDGSGAFFTATGAPKALIVEQVNGQVFALNSDSTDFGDQTDRWWAAALNDVGDWTPSLATLAVSGRLVSTTGPILAARRFNDDIVVYKENSVYLGRFVGTPAIWQFDVVTDEIGAATQEAVVSVNAAGLPPSHFWMGRDNFYVFNGTQPIPIGNPIRDFFFEDEFNLAFRTSVRGIWDKDNSRVIWFYPSLASTEGELDKYITFNPRNNKWGTPVDQKARVMFAFEPSTGPTYENLGDSYATYEDLPLIPYASAFWITTATRTGLFDTAGALVSLRGGGVDTSMIPSDIGVDEKNTFVSRVRPRFVSDPTTATLNNSWRDTLGGSLTSAAAAISLNNGKFDFERESRWHQFRIDTTGSQEIMGYDVEIAEGSDD